MVLYHTSNIMNVNYNTEKKEYLQNISDVKEAHNLQEKRVLMSDHCSLVLTLRDQV